MSTRFSPDATSSRSGEIVGSRLNLSLAMHLQFGRWSEIAQARGRGLGIERPDRRGTPTLKVEALAPAM
jgi:hypothetical protein